MTAQRYALIVGLLLIVAGGILGLWFNPTASGTQGTISCGSPWAGSEQFMATDWEPTGPQHTYTTYAVDCLAARQTWGPIAGVLAAVGAVAVGASFIRRPTPVDAPAPSHVV
jgi:hypothetical protein